ncbi:hypothetical protein BJX61DRAFT_541443 [Aspergillus egyptiacus]|nr:hypothetical protein BJX61DRAFT_541443 [Aspergillus egyptiacus]
MAPLTEEKAFRKVPKNWAEWSEAARKLKVFRSTINTAEGLQSGSRILHAQYLLMRAYRPGIIRQQGISVTDLDLENEYNIAATWLDSSEPFQSYIRSIRAAAAITPYSPNDPHVLGLFEIARSQQLELLDSIRTVPRMVSDEDTVNAGTLSLLSALTIKYPEPVGSWKIVRLGLRAQFRRDGFTARIDGYLLSNITRDVTMIVEVKPNRREKVEPQVSLQETAEIVAFIHRTGLGAAEQRYGFPDILSSFESTESIYLSTVTFSHKYKDYLNGARTVVTKDEFMVIQKYGPWLIDDAKAMEHIGRLVLAITIKYGG